MRGATVFTRKRCKTDRVNVFDRSVAAAYEAYIPVILFSKENKLVLAYFAAVIIISDD